jgi:hypothetical protein
MKGPELPGALDGLTLLNVTDRQRFKHAVEQGQQVGWAYYFPYLLSRSGNKLNSSALLCTEDAGSMCIFRWSVKESRPRLDLYLAPTPMNGAVLQRCLERANDFNGDYSARVERIDAKDADIAAASSGLRLRARLKQYIYSPTGLADLGGRNFRTLRRYVNRVGGLANLEVLPYSNSHAEACQALLRKWGINHRETHSDSGGMKISRRALEHLPLFSEPDVRGEIILIDDRLVGFAFGGEIRPGFASFFEAKNDASVQGLSYFQRHSFLSKLSDFDFVNDGSDVGRPGLRHIKNMLRPVSMLVIYRGTQIRYQNGT